MSPLRRYANNEFMAKKFGEVLAFCLVGQETVNKAGRTFIDEIGQDKVDRYKTHLAQLAAIIGEQAGEITRVKADKTAEKLRTLRETYVGDEWDNPTEILEWLGFFEGAAIVHWFLIMGSAESQNDLELGALAERGVDLHRKSLKNVEDHLRALGAKRAKQDG